MSQSGNTLEKAQGSALDAEAKPAVANGIPNVDEIADRSSPVSWLSLAAIFVAAFAVRWIYNFCFEHSNNFASCDAFEYIQNAQLLLDMKNFGSNFWAAASACLTGQASAPDWTLVRSTLAPMKDFYISGPVFPAFLAVTGLVCGLGSNIAQANQSITGIWPALLTGNVLVSALTCVMIALTANEAFGKRSATVAGWISVFYPAFIVNSGRLYSETFATCLLTALTYLTVRGFRKGGNSLPLIFLSGFLAAALQLSRSIMVAVSLVLIPLTALQKYSKDTFNVKACGKALCWLLPLFLGFSLVAIPWLSFQKLAFGTGGLVVDRVGRYNFFIGNNIDIQGWLSYPYPDGRGVESRSFGDLAVSAVKKNPVRWARLMLDKPLRLFKYPWNDFRTAIGPFTFHSQVLYHQLVVLFGLLGCAFAAFTSFAAQISRRELFARTFLFGLLAFHCVYYSFITVPRYNLSSIPEFIIFGAAAITLLCGMLRQVSLRGLASGIILTALSIFVLCQIDFAAIVDSMSMLTNSWTYQMSWGVDTASRTVLLLLLGAFSFHLVGKLQGHIKISRLIVVAATVAFLPLFIIPERANGRLGEWSENLGAGRSINQQLTLNRKDSLLQRGQSIYLLIDTQGVRQRADGLKVTVNGTEISGPFLPSLCFAESFDRFLEDSPGHVEREGERMWSSLSYSADMANVDQRQWTMVNLPNEVIQDARKRADIDGRGVLQFNVEISNTAAAPIRIYGSPSLSTKEQMIPSVSDYSWEKAFYGVENPRGLTDTRYDIKIPILTRQASDNDLSTAIGTQRGYYNIALLVSPQPVSHNSNARGLQLEFPEVINASPKEPFSLVSKLLFDSAYHDTAQQSILIMSIKGRAKLLSGNTGSPRITVSFKYRKADGSTFSYDPPWVPLQLNSAGSGNVQDFELALATKPAIDGARLEDATINFCVQPNGPAYSNLARSAEGTRIEFTELEAKINELPNSPFGIGLKVF